jgi:hypothetical protein
MHLAGLVNSNLAVGSRVMVPPVTMIALSVNQMSQHSLKTVIATALRMPHAIRKIASAIAMSQLKRAPLT